MRWTPGGNSDDVEDRRDDSGSGGMQFGGVHLGVGGLIIVFVLSLLFHRNCFCASRRRFRRGAHCGHSTGSARENGNEPG
jgi:predicted metalloprotease